MRSRSRSVAAHLVLALALLAGAYVREGESAGVTQAIIWLPSGIAIGGLWLLGLRAWWIVAACTLLHRASFGYGAMLVISAALGSTAEAVLGVLLLRRLGLRPDFARLRDVLTLSVAAVLAPLASILVSWASRSFLNSFGSMPFRSGWDGWWRMNALGVMSVVPLMLAWANAPLRRPSSRAVAEGLLMVAAILGVVTFVTSAVPPGPTAIMLMYSVLPVALYAAVRFGSRGAATAGAFGAACIVAIALHDGGPFVTIPIEERHVPIQILGLTLVTLPLVFGGLIAERETSATRWMQSERRHQALLASISRNVAEGLYRSTPEHGLVYVNQAFARMFGYESPEQLLQDPPEHGGARSPHRIDLDRLASGAEFHADREERFHRRDGSAFWCRVSSTSVRGADGRVTSFDGAISDITAHKLLEEQLRQAQKLEAVGMLAGGIAHDFNNLLTAICGYAEAIHADAAAESQQRADAAEILKASERAATLIRQLLAYSRQQVLTPQVLELATVVDHLGDLLRRVIGEDVALEIVHAEPHALVRVDRGQLEQVLLNLVVNARDAMPAGGTLTIRTDVLEFDAALARTHVDLAPGSYVVMTVRDTGVGMTREVQARAFDPFFTTKEQGKGTGLGLSTVYGIVKQSGGAVWLESDPGHGTVAWVCLPRSTGALVAAEPALPSPPARVRGTVLVVEDEPLVRDLVERTLVRAGYCVLAASDGVNALAVAREHAATLDLLVTDVVMPHMGGRELAARLAMEVRGIPVLFVSGYANDAQALLTQARTRSAFLQKPFTSSLLLEKVGAMLEASGELR